MLIYTFLSLITSLPLFSRSCQNIQVASSFGEYRSLRRSLSSGCRLDTIVCSDLCPLTVDVASSGKRVTKPRSGELFFFFFFAGKKVLCVLLRASAVWRGLRRGGGGVVSFCCVARNSCEVSSSKVALCLKHMSKSNRRETFPHRGRCRFTALWAQFGLRGVFLAMSSPK